MQRKEPRLLFWCQSENPVETIQQGIQVLPHNLIEPIAPGQRRIKLHESLVAPIDVVERADSELEDSGVVRYSGADAIHEEDACNDKSQQQQADREASRQPETLQAGDEGIADVRQQTAGGNRQNQTPESPDQKPREKQTGDNRQRLEKRPGGVPARAGGHSGNFRPSLLHRRTRLPGAAAA